jgi:cystathionine beta-lyase
MFDFDTIIDRKDTGSIKWDSNVKLFKNPDVIPMWVADMDFQSPPQVNEALLQRAQHGIYGYTEVSERYLEQIKNWMQRRFHWPIRTEWVVHSPTVYTSLYMLVQALTAPRDKILIQTPVYPPFHTCVLDNDRELIFNPLQRQGAQYVMDFDDLDHKLAGKVKMMILCSPHNPVGRVWSTAELVRVAELCLKHNVLLISDEIHSDLVFKGHQHHVMAAVAPELEKQLITLTSPSKTFNLAALSTSFAVIADADLRNRFKSILKNTHAWAPNIFGLIAAEVAYEFGDPWVEELLAYLEANRDLLLDFISKHIPALQAIKPEGTYLAWLDGRELGLGEDLNAFFAIKAKVGFSDGKAFGIDGQGFQRINFACPRSRLLQALRNMETAVKARTL